MESTLKVCAARISHPDGGVPGSGEIFVFGSNLAGRHGKGAALLAKEAYGAQIGVGSGPSGQSYAIPTKDVRLDVLPIEVIRRYVSDFKTYARLHPAQTFFLTRIGCGLAGFANSDIAPLFADAPANCSFPSEWMPYLAHPAEPRPTYAGIGSRSTPPEILTQISRVAGRLSANGYLLRSGGATGADTAFESGADMASEIFLPWRRFNDNDSPLFTPSQVAFRLAATLHPAWSRLDGKAQHLMARNCHQILGLDLRSPVDFVVAWTPDGAETEAERTRETGCTGQAIALADRNGIPVFNLARPGALQRIKARLDELNLAPGSVPESQLDVIHDFIKMFPGARVVSSRSLH